jgi:hypothetical protein
MHVVQTVTNHVIFLTERKIARSACGRLSIFKTLSERSLRASTHLPR